MANGVPHRVQLPIDGRRFAFSFLKENPIGIVNLSPPLIDLVNLAEFQQCNQLLGGAMATTDTTTTNNNDNDNNNDTNTTTTTTTASTSDSEKPVAMGFSLFLSETILSTSSCLC